MLPSLEKLLSYNNQFVLDRYSKDYPANTLSAKEAFTELLKFFWLCEKHRADILANPHEEALKFQCAIHFEMKEIDDMWHTFILFTKDYMQFGEEFFGAYIHHNPAEEGKKLSPDEFEIDLERYFSYIYDNLGEETLSKWFAQLLTE